MLSIEDAQANLRQITAALEPGEELTLIDNGQPLARLVKSSEETSWPCKAGSAKDKILWIAPDFDVPLDDFAEYRLLTPAPAPAHARSSKIFPTALDRTLAGGYLTASLLPSSVRHI